MSQLELSITSDWGKIAGINENILVFLESCELPAESANRYAMVACELTENAIKYGSFEEACSSISLCIKVGPRDISIEVTNHIGGGSHEYLRELDRTIQWIRGFQDPFEAYLERMQAISRESMDADRSGLGLVRITYEGRAALDFFIGDERTLSVSAVSEL